jgi:hypothetical protein
MRKMELDPLILRWKKTTRALKIHEQHFGRYITDILERRTDEELALFRDPVEAAAFFCLLDLMIRQCGRSSQNGLPDAMIATNQQPIPAELLSR